MGAVSDRTTKDAYQMSGGYTPIFDSVYHGTLCGRWPTLAVWLTILPMADKNGQVDLTYQAISALTGWPIDLLKQAISELMQPDPDSRSPGEDGRRLVLVDPENRQWGWRVVNHTTYREKARKQMQQIEATQSGRDAERKRLERASKRPAMSGDVQPRPEMSSRVRLSDSDSDSDKEKNKKAAAPPDLDALAWEKWVEYRKRRKPAIRPESIEAAQRKLAAFGIEQMAVVENSIANGYQGLIQPKGSTAPRKSYQRAPTTAELEAEERAHGSR